MRYIHHAVLMALFVALSGAAQAGSLDSPAAPTDAGSGMCTLEDIYNRLNSGAAGTKRVGAFVEPGAGPTAGTGHTLDEVMGKAPTVDDADGAASGDVLSGKKFWGLRTGGWGNRTGSMANVGKQDITPGASAQTITQGYHDGSGSVAGDAGLVAGNIKKDVSIFGVTGTLDSDTVACAGTRWSNTAQDPAGRWCDNNDGTVTDLFGHNGRGKGLVWLKKADWAGQKAWRNGGNYDDAHARAGVLQAGTEGAGLDDGSAAGDWRLPTRYEMWSLNDGTHKISSGAPGPFTGVQFWDQKYWTSSTDINAYDEARVVFVGGGQNTEYKYQACHVWPVRARR